MKASRKTMTTVLAAAGFALLAGAAYAFPPGAGPCGGGYGGGPGMGMGMGNGPGMGRWGGGPGPMAGGGPGFRGGFAGGPGFAAAADARLAYLKSELKITANQEAAWSAYAAQVKQQAETMTALRAAMTNTPQNAADRAAQRAGFMKQRAAGAETMSAAVKDLYAALTPEQQAIADQQFGGWRMAQGPRGYGPGQGPRGYGPRW